MNIKNEEIWGYFGYPIIIVSGFIICNILYGIVKRFFIIYEYMYD